MPKQVYPKGFETTGALRPLYNKWASMRHRCETSVKKHEIERYQNRGITVCAEWKNDWVAFAQWALENGYKYPLEIDRRDNDKGYSPDNCRFVDKITQNQNRDLNLTYLNIKKGQSRRWFKPFRCIQTGQVFPTEIEASRVLKIERRNIGRVLRNIYKQVKGYTFEYVDAKMEDFELTAQ